MRLIRVFLSMSRWRGIFNIFHASVDQGLLWFNPEEAASAWLLEPGRVGSPVGSKLEDESVKRGIVARPPAISPQQKAQLVLMVLARELSITEAARKAGVSGQAVSNWRRQFIKSGIQGLDGGDRQSTERERHLSAEIVELKKALGEIYIQLRAQRSPLNRKLAVSGSRQGHVAAENALLRQRTISSR